MKRSTFGIKSERLSDKHNGPILKEVDGVGSLILFVQNIFKLLSFRFCK